jgi:erythromycin esterase-like protein
MRLATLLLIPMMLSCNSTTPPTAADFRPHALNGSAQDYDPLLGAIGNAHLVLLGEATHGTHEFYVERARITRRLIAEKQFTALALEAEWADAARLDAYVKGTSGDASAREALGAFTDFPRWMWANAEFAELLEWIREHNASLPPGAIRTGVYGLDLYGADESRKAIQHDLMRVDPAFAREVAALSAKEQLDRIRARRVETKEKASLDALFFAEQNARVVVNADEYEREQRRGAVSTWNLRDRHMVVMMEELQRYLLARNGHDNIVVWAHNSHVGDARATARARYGEWNMGQLVREHWPRGASFTLGFTTHHGTVLAASQWGGQPRVQQLRPSMAGSHGAIFHELGLPRFLILLEGLEVQALQTARQQRAVGVLYLPHSEFDSHYFTATLQEQFDAVIHIDETRALTPL